MGGARSGLELVTGCSPLRYRAVEGAQARCYFFEAIENLSPRAWMSSAAISLSGFA